jgi:hypothetical protein
MGNAVENEVMKVLGLTPRSMMVVGRMRTRKPRNA